MADTGKLVGPKLEEHIRDSNRRVRGGPTNDAGGLTGVPSARNWQIVRVNGAVIVSGGDNYFSAKLTQRVEPAADWIDLGDVWAIGMNNETLVNGTRYEATQSGLKTLNGETKDRPVFVAATPC